MPRIIITGSSGFIGERAIEHFLEVGYEVLATDITVPGNPDHQRVYRQCDLLDKEKLTIMFTDFDPDYLLHLGARTDVFERKSIAGYDANITGTKNIIDAANACLHLKRVIITSSRLVCPVGHIPKTDDEYCPPNFYGESKVQTELLVKNSALKSEWVITRPTAIWGEGFRVPSYRDFFEQIKHGRYFNLGSSSPQKTFGYVRNFNFQMEKLLLAPKESVHGKVFYIGDYTPVALRSWAKLIAHEFGQPPPRTLPLPVLRSLARVGDLFRAVGWKTFPLCTTRLNNMLQNAVHDCTVLETITGPLPYDLESATKRTVAWLKQNP